MSTQNVIILVAVVVVALLLIFGRSGSSRTSQVDPSKIQLGPIRHDTLSEPLLARIRELQRVFSEVYPRSMDEWSEGFRRDLEPEREVAIWEAMASAYSSFTTNRTLTFEAKREVLGFLLQRSAGDEQSVLASAAPKHLTRPEVEQLVRLYAAAPQPVRVISK
ncbi:MAG: hypothetical protein O2999_04910 [Nitrospirae bacterium]|nr:hypothetical protein [Nitrospirota bacterium]